MTASGLVDDWLDGWSPPRGPTTPARTTRPRLVDAPETASPAESSASRPVETPTPRGQAPADALTAWRAAERQLALISLGSPEWLGVEAEVNVRRARYRQLFDERTRR
ncbi:MAG: hypothetical protein NVS9B8_16670 [Candidatus Limnocylindrales bacterium]